MKQQVITASVFISFDNKVLLVKRSDSETFAPGHWELPGGHVNFGETTTDALVREAKEETGLDVKVKNAFHEFTYIIPEENKHYIEVIYMASLKNVNQEIVLNPDEHSTYRWVSLDEFKKDFDDMFDLEKNAVFEGFKQVSQ